MAWENEIPERYRVTWLLDLDNSHHAAPEDLTVFTS